MTFSKKQLGASAVESLIALPIVLMLMLGAAEWARIYEAKTILDHAAFMGARSGSFNHALLPSITKGVARGMLPFYAPPADQVDKVLSKLEAKVATNGARVRILNPTKEAFQDFGITKDGVTYIPSTDLHLKSTAVGAKSGINIQDANLLKVEVVWGVELRMPFISTFISLVGQATTNDPFELQLYKQNMLPVISTSLVRMQSDAYLSNGIVSITDFKDIQRTQGGPEETLIPLDDTTGEVDPGSPLPTGPTDWLSNPDSPQCGVDMCCLTDAQIESIINKKP